MIGRRFDPALAAMVLAAFAAYGLLSIVRHETFRSGGFDLGLFEQVIRHYSEFETPASAIKGLPTIFHDHVSPILAVLGPVYALWSATAALLTVQAAALAASAVPLFLYANRRLGRGQSLALTGAYLLFGGLQEGAWHDFHEVALAPPLIGLAIVLADRGRWRASLVAALSLLLVKEDLSFLVMAFGVWFMVKSQRRLGLVALAAGAAWYLAVTNLVVPGYGYTEGYDLGNLFDLEWPKLRTIAYLFGAYLGVSLRSPLVILAIPLLAERFLSPHPNHWTLENHYSLTIAPVLAFAAADALGRLDRVAARRLVAAMLAIAVLLVPAFPLAQLFRPGFYSPVAAYRDAGAALAVIPPEARVAAQNRLASHLDGRAGLTVLTPAPAPSAYIVASVRDADPGAIFPFADLAELRRTLALAATTRPTLFGEGGIVVLGPR